MKLAILSDFHLGYERFSRDAYAQAAQALEAASQAADVLLIPGDIFDMRAPKPEVLAEAINLFRNLQQKKWAAKVVDFKGEGAIYSNAPIIAIPGTHERRAAGAADPVDLLNLAGLLVDISDATAMIAKGDEKVAVRGLGGIAEERFRESLIAADVKPVAGAFNVFLFHQSVYELLPFSKDFINIDELPKGFDLYVDGHIHGRVEKRAHGKPFLIPGSTVLTQLKDSEQEQKGFYIFDTTSGKYEFHKISSRKFSVVTFNVGSKEPAAIRNGVERAIDAAILEAGANEPIIRVELHGKLRDGFKHIDLDLAGIPRSYKGKAMVEIAKGSMELTETEALSSDVRKGTLDNVSVKDFGMGILMTNLARAGYKLKVNPTALFELLSADLSKDKTVKKVLEELFEKG